MNHVVEAQESALNSCRIALIGCGAIAELFYLPAFTRDKAKRENLILVDRNENRVKMMAEKFDVKNYTTDYRNVLDSDLTGVIIALPTPLHHPIIQEFLSNRVHVLSEKPLAMTADEARDLVHEAERQQVKLCMNQTRRFFPSYIKVKELLYKTELGEPLSIEYCEGEDFIWPTTSGFYFNSKFSSRGVLLDRGAHVLDLVCWWLDDKPQLLSCLTDSFGGPEAVAEVQFRHRQCVGRLKFSLLGKTASRFTITCGDGRIEGDIHDFQNIELVSKKGSRKRLQLDSKEKTFFDFGSAVASDFINVILNGKQPRVAGHEILDAMECIEECYRIATQFPMPWYEIGSGSHAL